MQNCMKAKFVYFFVLFLNVNFLFPTFKSKKCLVFFLSSIHTRNATFLYVQRKRTYLELSLYIPAFVFKLSWELIS